MSESFPQPTMDQAMDAILFCPGCTEKDHAIGIADKLFDSFCTMMGESFKSMTIYYSPFGRQLVYMLHNNDNFSIIYLSWEYFGCTSVGNAYMVALANSRGVDACMFKDDTITEFVLTSSPPITPTYRRTGDRYA